MKIMCQEDFDRVFNMRIADKCCANCKYSKCEHEGYATCSHPARNDGGYCYEEGEETSKCWPYNTMRSNVCDGWGPKEKKGEMK